MPSAWAPPARSIPERLQSDPGGRRRAGSALARRMGARHQSGGLYGSPWQTRPGCRGDGRVPGAPLAGLASPYGLIPDRRVVLERGDPPGAAVDVDLDPAASALWAQRAPARGLLHARRGRHLLPSPVSITAPRVGEILPLSHP